MLHLPIVSTDRNATHGSLHAVCITVSRSSESRESAIVCKTLFKKRNSLVEFTDIVCVLIVQHMLTGTHFQSEGISKLSIAMDIVSQSCKLIDILPNAIKSLIDGSNRLIAMCEHLVDNLQRKFSDMLLSSCRLYVHIIREDRIDWKRLSMLLSNIFHKLLTIRTTALIEARIDGVLIRIHQL